MRQLINELLKPNGKTDGFRQQTSVIGYMFFLSLGLGRQTVFKVLRNSSLSNVQRHTKVHQNIDLELLAKYCQIEDWSASVDSGIFKLGDLSAFKHGIHSSSCGMLNLINNYAAEDKDHIAEIFEIICAHNSTFSYSTMIVSSDGLEQPVTVIGESIIEHTSDAVIKGVFIFPYAQNEVAQEFRQ